VNRVSMDYDPQSTPNPYNGNLRVRETVKQGARRARQAVWRLIKLGLILGAVGIILVVIAAKAILFLPNLFHFWGSVIAQGAPPEVGATETRQVVTINPTPSPLSTDEPNVVQSEQIEPVLTSEMDEMPLILIPAGTFEMGNPQGGQKPDTLDEYPNHVVNLDAFYIDRHEVTNDQYHRCVYAGACEPPQSPASQTSDSYYEKDRFSKHPVIKVRWTDAQAYCTWVGRRLPTEAEWEKAARWDPEENKSHTFPWGDNSPTEALTNFEKKAGDTMPVGSFPAGSSPFGLEDMAGNVWEWVLDWYASDYYEQSTDRNPSGPEEGVYKTMRGGSWSSPAQDLRTTARKYYAPQESRFDTGFRCAMDIP
jgi:formylglycine-generating enzyme required for sulfatase activity